jgi:hypothetical protein
MTDSTDNRLPAEAFSYLGRSLFGEKGWQAKMARELEVDEPTVNQWAVDGPPANLAGRLSHIAGYHRGQIQAPLTMPGMPDACLKPWERAARLLEEYEGLTQDPTMIYSSRKEEDNRDMIVRVFADMLHYCMHKMSENRSFIDIAAVLKKAIELYNSEPHSAMPVKTEERAPKDLIPYVLCKDPAIIAEFEKRFGITQDQAADELIEATDLALDMPQYVGHKGTSMARLEALRRALHAGGVEE